MERRYAFPIALLSAGLRMAAYGADPAADDLHARPERIEAWKDLRFGMFLCWGPVTLTGKEIGWSRGVPPWGRRPGLRGGTGPTPVEVYDTLYKRWKPERFDAEHWIAVAEEAGMKYLIFLVKHHDGFCLYDSALTDYKSTGPLSAWKVDVLREVAEACRRHGLKLFLYYSQPDWHHPDYLGDRHDRYIAYLHGQIRELLTNYGPIDGLWFDGLRRRGEARDGSGYEGAELWQAEALFRMARTLQPQLLINDRAGLPGDFDTPENRVGFFQADRPWETNATLTGQWAWKPDDPFFRSFEEVIRMLVCVVTGDGNFALNTGPMPDGRIEPRQVERLRRIGRWLGKYGESIYRTRGGPFLAPDERTRRDGGYYAHFSLPEGRWWGGSTHRGKTAYLHILRWPGEGIVLPAIGRKLVASSVLTGGRVDGKQDARGIAVSVPPGDRDPLDTIVRLDFDGPLAGLGPVLAAPRPRITVTETPLAGGDSEIRISEAGGNVRATYRIPLTPHHHPASDETDPVIRDWATWKFGAFLCFNTNTFTGREICTAGNPGVFAPPTLDAERWIAAFEAAGMSYAVLTARHTSGFLLWDSATSDHDVASSGNRTDVVGVFVAACRRRGLRPGIYYCLWGGAKCGVTGRREVPGARATILAQLHELATRYGPIPYFWLDMMNWAPRDLKAQEIYDSLKNASPNAVVIFNQHIQDGSEIRYFPTDVLDGEMTLPPAGGHDPRRTIEGKTYYLPFELNLTSQSWEAGRLGGMYGKYAWFTYGEGLGVPPSRPFPPGFLYRHIRRGYDRGASNVLLACAPDRTGRMREEDVRQLAALGRMLRDPAAAPPMPITYGCEARASGVWPKPRLDARFAFDDDPSTRWGGAPGTRSGWLEVDLGAARTFRRLWVSEAYDRIRRFALQVREDGTWRAVLEGTAVGSDFSASFDPVTARYVRLAIHEATDVPTIWEVQLFEP